MISHSALAVHDTHLMHRIVRICLLFFSLFLIATWALFAQNLLNYHVRHYDTQNGLSNNWVSALAQDQNGHLWVGTQYGLNRFDGFSFQTYTYKTDQPGLGGNWVRSLYPGADQELWIGTFGGGFNILDVNKNEFQLHTVQDSFRKGSLLSFLPKDRDEMYISTGDGAYLINRTGIKTTISPHVTNTLSIVEDDLYLLATRQGLVIKSKTEQLDTILFDQHWVGDLLSISKDSTLLNVQGELLLLSRNAAGWQITDLDINIPIHPQFFHTSFLYQDSKRQIWLPGQGQLWCLSPNLKKRTACSLEDLLPYRPEELPSLHCMLEDRKGVIWIGTNQGLLQLSPIKPFSHPVLAKATDGRLPNTRGITALDREYLFTSASEVYYWTPDKAEPPTPFAEVLLLSPYRSKSDRVYGILKQNDGWQLVQVDIQHQAFLPLPCYPDVRARWKIIKEDQLGRLWISNWKNLVCYNPEQATCFQVALKTDDGNPIYLQVTDLLLDQIDRLWIASQAQGLFLVENASKIQEGDNIVHRHYEHAETSTNNLSSSIVQALHEDVKGNIWVGTDGGLNLYQEEEDRFKQWLRSPTMPDDKILDIESDDSGTLWMSTASHGILAFAPTKEQFTNYTRKDGLYADDMLIGSAFRDDEGRIWLGSTDGLQAFLPEQIFKQQSQADTLIWQQLDIHRKDTTIHLFFPKAGQDKEKPLIVHHDDHNLSLSFAWLNFRHAGRQQYRYRLEGIHSDWLPAPANGLVSLSQLPAGRYTLLVKARTSGGQLEAFALPIHLRVLPPWYQTSLAYVIYALLALGIAYFTYRIQLSRQLAAVEREQAEALVASKMRFFRQIAHEFRSPLTLVFGAVEQIKQRLREAPRSQVQPQLDQLQEQASYLTRQVDEILELAKLQADRSPLQLETADFVRYQRFLLQSYSSLAEAKEISLHFQAEPNSLTFPFDADKWRKITGNLISNALKFTPPGGRIQLTLVVKTSADQDMLHLSLSDNGQGISPHFLEHLFEPFAQGNEQPTGGTGIGLALTKALVEQHGGTISVESTLGQGSRFDIILPIKPLGTVSAIESPKIASTQDLPLILLAEDHAAVRGYIRECLAESYQIQETQNGTEAWEVCLAELPDLVISDIMMPGGSGLELSKRIRDNERTNHIPLILLTGKSDQEDRIKGLRAGADVYLTKPFHREELLLRIQGLLDVRKRLQEKYQSGDFTVQSDTQASDTFMQQVVEIIHNEIDNEVFSVEALAKQLHLSRVQLFRKIKALTNLTPTLLIRQIRLRRAHQLLRESEQTISEIAYACGFKDPAYFSRVYKEQYGQSPSEGRS